MTLADDERLVRDAIDYDYADGASGESAFDRILSLLHAYEKEHEAVGMAASEGLLKWVSTLKAAHDEAERIRKEGT